MQLIRSQLFARHGWIAVFTTRDGGVSPPPVDSLNFAVEPYDEASRVDNNLQRLLQAVPLARPPLRTTQVHGTKVLCCDPGIDPRGQQADALIARAPETPLAVQTADCLPVLLADPEAGLAAAVHAGWRGTAGRIVRRAIERMCRLGAKPGRIIAALGPAIGPCCFEIDAATAKALRQCARDAHLALVRRQGRWHANLAMLNRMQLMEAGVNAHCVEIHRACTCCDARRFFSHRRERGRTGRHLAVVAGPTNP